MFFESLRISLSSIYMNKLRSILTALGIIIGVLLGRIFYISVVGNGLVIWNGGRYEIDRA